MKYFLNFTIVLNIISAGFVSALADDTTSRYQSWQPPAGEIIYSRNGSNDANQKYQLMIDKLNTLVDDAEKARAADRHFIQDLRDVLNEYDWPWRVTLIDEDFTDGKIAKSPNWEISSGDFRLERGLGLYSKVKPPRATSTHKKTSDKDLAIALLGALLKGKSDSKKSYKDEKDQKAAIEINKRISNAFALNATIDSRNKQGKISLSLYQGKSTGPAYRLVFLPGDSASIELQRIGRQGTTIIDVADKVQAKGNKTHKLQWTRDTRGNMKIDLNGKTIMQTSDRGLRDPFSGFGLINHSGEFAVQRVNISGVK